MHALRTAAALLGTITLCGLGASTAVAKDAGIAKAVPATAAPGQNVTVTVVCEHSEQKTVTARSRAFATGTAALTAGPDGRTFTGPVTIGSAKESSWAIDGQCPAGDRFAGELTVGRGRTGHDSRHNGLGGSMTSGSGQFAAGGALVLAGIGGFWLLRRRTVDGPRI